MCLDLFRSGHGIYFQNDELNYNMLFILQHSGGRCVFIVVGLFMINA